MTLRANIARLRRELDRRAGGDGVCWVCGGREGDVTTIFIGRAGPDTKRLHERVPEREQPNRPRCPACGMYMMPVVFIREEA